MKRGVAMTDLSRTETWAESADLLGPLIPHLTTSMGLDNIPKPCPCDKHRQAPGVPKGLTHLPTEPCPFEPDGFPAGAFATCCSLRGKKAAHELEALGENNLADRMHEDMTAEEALAFADELVAAAGRLEGLHAGQPDKPKGAGWNGTWDSKKKDWVYRDYSTFEQALDSIREAARWFEKVGKFGYGVHAWY